MSKPTSIIRKISIQMSVIVVILLAALILSNIYSIDVVYNNAIASSKQALAYHTNNIQNSLSNTSMDLLEVFDSHIDPFLNYESLSEEQKYFARIELRRSMSPKLSKSGATDMLFMSIRREGLFLASASNRIFSREGLYLTDYMKAQRLDGGTKQAGVEWFSLELNGQAYLLKILQYSDVVFGAVVKATTLSSFIEESANDQNLFYLRDTSGTVLASTNITGHDIALENDKHPNYLYITESVPEFGQITHVVERRNVFLGLEIVQWLIIGLSVTALIAMLTIIRSFSKHIFGPILKLVRGAKEVETGNWDYEFQGKSISLEFDRLFNSFNSMIREVKSLKIVSYEEKLERNKAELKFLQMQLKPHFFLNAISTISSLTFYNKNEEIRQMINYLSNHLRYMFKGGLAQVEVEEEIQHVANYIRMQAFRYPDRIFYMSDIPDDLRTHRLPQYSIHTFVENTFKHALSYKDMLSIFIKVDRIHMQGLPFVRITIEDDGEGFPDSVISSVHAGISKQTDLGEQVGIVNIERTLKLLYKRKDLLRLSNIEPSGARVEIFIPYEEH